MGLTFGYCICLVMIGLVLLGMVNAVRLRLYLKGAIVHFFYPKDPVERCGVSLVYEQDMELMEELNQANAKCSSSSRIITYEGWDGVHHGFVN